MIFTKEAHRSAKFQTFDCSGEISPNLYFDRLLFLKVYKVSAKKIWRSYVSWYQRVVQNLKKNWFFVSKMTRIWWNLTWALASLQNLHFYLLLLCKVFNVWPKKVQRSYLSWHWRVMQNLKNNWLVIWKMTWGIWQIFTRALKASKLVFSWDPIIQSSKSMTLNLTEGLCVLPMWNDTKFEEELTCCLKSDMRNLTEFDPSTWKP